MSDAIANLQGDAFLRHFHEVRDLKREHKEIGMRLARAKKAAKSDGVDLDALAALEKLVKLDDDEAALQMRNTMRYLRFLGKPLGTQLDWIDAVAATPQPNDKSANEHRVWQAEQDGYAAGRAGRGRDDNPYDAGAETFVAFDKGYTRGQKVLADKLGENAKAAEPRRSRKQPAEIVSDPVEVAPARRGRGRRSTNGAHLTS